MTNEREFAMITICSLRFAILEHRLNRLEKLQGLPGIHIAVKDMPIEERELVLSRAKVIAVHLDKEISEFRFQDLDDPAPAPAPPRDPA